MDVRDKGDGWGGWSGEGDYRHWQYQGSARLARLIASLLNNSSASLYYLQSHVSAPAPGEALHEQLPAPPQSHLLLSWHLSCDSSHLWAFVNVFSSLPGYFLFSSQDRAIGHDQFGGRVCFANLRILRLLSVVVPRGIEVSGQWPQAEACCAGLGVGISSSSQSTPARPYS